MEQQYDLINDSPVIRTYMRKWVNVFEPTPDMFDIRDIAHSLSVQPRFSGHTQKHYSVAGHSIWCYEKAKEMGLSLEAQLTALMHDASEAYLVDIPRPIKKQFSQYKVIENELMTTLSSVFGFQWPMSETISYIDNLALQKEWDFLMIEKPGAEELYLYDAKDAEELFLKIFKYLKEKLDDNN